MKVFSVIALLVLLTFQMFLKVGIAGYYGLNIDYITANFCENASRPEMRCNGKCYLRKQLSKADESGNYPKHPQKAKTEAQPYLHFANELRGGMNSSAILFANAFPPAIKGHPGSIFHPPAA